MAPSDEPIRTPRAQRVLTFRQRQLPGLVWAACAVVCAWMLVTRVQRFEYVGLAQVAEHEISSPQAGRLVAVFVDLYEPVGVGDILTGNPMQPIIGAGISSVVRFRPDEPPLIRAEVDQEQLDIFPLLAHQQVAGMQVGVDHPGPV